MNHNFSQNSNRENELKVIERQLRQTELIHRKDVQNLLNLAGFCKNPQIYASILNRLRMLLEEYQLEVMRRNDPFMPYCPEALSRNGNLLLTVQQDNVPIYVDHNKLVTGMGIIGPQGGGKSRYIIHLCNELRKIDPNIVITIVDPKDGFSGMPSFEHIDLANVSFDLTPPANIDYESFGLELMPILAAIANLKYGLNILNQATEEALELRRKYPKETSLSLKDIQEAIRGVYVKNFRETGYKDAALTALSLIIGTGNLFACRRGISMERLFCRNMVINARCLTNATQCRFFAVYLIYWLYQRARFSPETNRLKHIIIVDDATRFVGADTSGYDNTVSPLGNLLAVLRSSGTCFCFATQLPSKIDPDVLSLTRNLAIVGNASGEDNLRVIRNCMSLNDFQKNAIIGFKTRETLSFISGHQWPRPIHGWTPYVPDMARIYISNNDYIDIIESWKSLKDIPQNETPQPEAVPVPQPEQTGHAIWKVLVWDCISYMFDKVRDRVKRLGISIREYESAKTEAAQNGYLLESTAGKTKYLIPTQKAFAEFHQPCPYERATSIEHAFYVLLAAHILKQKPEIASVKTEVPIGSQGSTIDVVSTDKSGNAMAYEVTLSTSNLLSNAAKLQDTAYVRIVWLCRDAATAQAVKSYFGKSSLSSELSSKFEYMHFSKFDKPNT